jgi:serine/threonine-protein kinase HipA
VGEISFQAPASVGVPPLVELGRLLQVNERILRDEETDEDLQLIFAPGSSLGGARPKTSVVDQHGHLSIAKFPKETDEYSIGLPQARTLIKEVAEATATWQAVAKEVGARAAEINRMSSAFEHDDLRRALAL